MRDGREEEGGGACFTTKKSFPRPLILDVSNHSGGSKNFEKGGAEHNSSVRSSFIANAYTRLYAFYTEKAAF